MVFWNFMTSSLLFANPRNSVSRNVIMMSQWDSTMPDAAPPAAMRSRKPTERMQRSIMAMRFSLIQ